MRFFEIVDELPESLTRKRNPVYDEMIDEFISSGVDVARIKAEEESFAGIHWESIVIAARKILKMRQISAQYKIGVRTFDKRVSLYMYKIG